MGRYLFSNVVANLRSNGGDVETFIHLIRTPGATPLSEQSKYDDATVTVDLTIPFTYNGEELCVTPRGVYVAEEEWNCFTVLHRRSKMELALDMATECAIQRGVDEIIALLKKVRPTTSARRLKRKSQAVINLCFKPNIALIKAKGDATP